MFNRWLVQMYFLPLMTTAAKLFCAGVGLYLVIRIYRFLCEPIDRVKLLGDVGYVAEGGRQSTKELVIEQVRRRRAVGDVPPVYPNGWFALTESRSLPVGHVKNIFCLGTVHYEIILQDTPTTEWCCKYESRLEAVWFDCNICTQSIMLFASGLVVECRTRNNYVAVRI